MIRMASEAFWIMSSVCMSVYMHWVLHSNNSHIHSTENKHWKRSLLLTLYIKLMVFVTQRQHFILWSPMPYKIWWRMNLSSTPHFSCVQMNKISICYGFLFHWLQMNELWTSLIPVCEHQYLLNFFLELTRSPYRNL